MLSVAVRESPTNNYRNFDQQVFRISVGDVRSSILTFWGLLFRESRNHVMGTVNCTSSGYSIFEPVFMG